MDLDPVCSDRRYQKQETSMPQVTFVAAGKETRTNSPVRLCHPTEQAWWDVCTMLRWWLAQSDQGLVLCCLLNKRNYCTHHTRYHMRHNYSEKHDWSANSRNNRESVIVSSAFQWLQYRTPNVLFGPHVSCLHKKTEQTEIFLMRFDYIVTPCSLFTLAMAFVSISLSKRLHAVPPPRFLSVSKWIISST